MGVALLEPHANSRPTDAGAVDSAIAIIRAHAGCIGVPSITIAALATPKPPVCATCGDTSPLPECPDCGNPHAATPKPPVDEPWPGYTADQDKRRVVALAKLGLMLSVMAGGEAPEVTGFDAADLYGEVLMSLGIEDADDTDIALQVARDDPEGRMLTGGGAGA